MSALDLHRAIDAIKSRAACAARATRRISTLQHCCELAGRLERMERLACVVEETLSAVADVVPGLTVSRRTACASWVIEAGGRERVRPAGFHRDRLAWTRLEVRLSFRDDGQALLLSARGTVCDADLPVERETLPMPSGSEDDLRAWAERCALEFAQALLARRAALRE